MTITLRSFTKARHHSAKSIARRYGRNRTTSPLLNPRPGIPSNILIETMDGAVTQGRENADEGTIGNATTRGGERGMGNSLIVPRTSDSTDGGTARKSSHDDERYKKSDAESRKVDSAVAEILPDDTAPRREKSSNNTSNPPTREENYDDTCTKKNSINGSKRQRLNGSYVLDVEISDCLVTSSNQTKSHRQAPTSKTLTTNNTTDQASASTSKACSNPKSIGFTSNKSLKDILDNSIFRNNSKECSVSKSSSQTKSKSVTTATSASIKKSMGISTSSTAKTKNTVRNLTGAKKMTTSKFRTLTTTCPKHKSRMGSLLRKDSLPRPDTVSVRAKQGRGNDDNVQSGEGGIDVWVDGGDDNVENCPRAVDVASKKKKKKVLCDSNVVNRVNRDECKSLQAKIHC
eukprot:CCRYP_019697-RA/>CCRYP_019697-RA protein AED:0.42 eAED:0.67 QI:0/-1/0/1/-1/1/1/0/402